VPARRPFRPREWLEREAVFSWLMLTPPLLFLVAFLGYPFCYGVYLSFVKRQVAQAPTFVGVANFVNLWHDPIFWQALSNNLWYALGTIPLSIALALLMAVWVNERLPGRGFVRLAYFTPTVLPMIAVANIWLFFYTPGYGLLEQVTSALGFPSSRRNSTTTIWRGCSNRPAIARSSRACCAT